MTICVPRLHIVTNGFTVALLEQMLHSDICEQITHDKTLTAVSRTPVCTCIYTCIYVCKNILRIIIMNDADRIKFYINLIAVPQSINSDTILIINLIYGYK